MTATVNMLLWLDLRGPGSNSTFSAVRASYDGCGIMIPVCLTLEVLLESQHGAQFLKWAFVVGLIWDTSLVLFMEENWTGGTSLAMKGLSSTYWQQASGFQPCSALGFWRDEALRMFIVIIMTWWECSLPLLWWHVENVHCHYYDDMLRMNQWSLSLIWWHVENDHCHYYNAMFTSDLGLSSDTSLLCIHVLCSVGTGW